MKFLDPEHPVFRNPLVRWLTVLLPIAWGLVEFFVVGSLFWAGLFVGLGLYAGWMLFVRR